MQIWIGALLLFVFGGFLGWSGIRSIRHDLHIHGLPWIEQKMLDAVGEEPLPRTRIDRFLSGLNQWLSAIFGPVIAMLGLVIAAVELGVLG